MSGIVIPRRGLQMVVSKQRRFFHSLRFLVTSQNVIYYAGDHSTEDQEVTLICISASLPQRLKGNRQTLHPNISLWILAQYY